MVKGDMFCRLGLLPQVEDAIHIRYVDNFDDELAAQV